MCFAVSFDALMRSLIVLIVVESPLVDKYGWMCFCLFVCLFYCFEGGSQVG